jgi:hypothetical protein
MARLAKQASRINIVIENTSENHCQSLEYDLLIVGIDGPQLVTLAATWDLAAASLI